MDGCRLGIDNLDEDDSDDDRGVLLDVLLFCCDAKKHDCVDIDALLVFDLNCLAWCMAARRDATMR